ncbi:MAG TPA: phosphatidate cytidylyltransferase [Vicinamibacterales bacterium]|nr:phosphatidate cytidylyltransferase [Vicinamibacterales bacterium]
MSSGVDTALLRLVGGVLALLVVASAIGALMHRFTRGDPGRAMVENINARIRAWWVMASVFAISVITGAVGSIALFTVISFLAMREFVTLAPTRRADHRALLWCFFAVTPVEYALIWIGWYGLFSILIPVYISIFVAIRVVLAGDTERFLERTATLQWAVMICVYFVSYVPALLMLRIPGHERQNAKLMFFLVLVVELSDVLQYIWGKAIGRRRIAPSISPNKTWAGFVGGTLSASAIGAAIWWATPFGPMTAATMAFVVTLMGFAGGLIMSAIKRDRGVKDYGSLIEGHGGILDRIDSLCFAAPVFFHLTRYFFAA